MDKVAILMSTYNGEKYLREQIDSILFQKGVEVTLYIRDDGSSDGTIDIVKKYAQKYQNIIWTIGKNVGVGNSFMQLIYDCPDDFDYYAFSDQDDIWLEDKLKVAIDNIKPKDRPALYASNQMLVDENGSQISLRYPKDYDMQNSVEAQFQINRISGCTFVFNKMLKKVLSEPVRRPTEELLRKRIHDVWVSNVAALYDGIVYDNNAYIQYRQHENNVVGAYAYGHLYDLKEKIKKIKNPAYRNGRSSISLELCRTFPEKAITHPLVYCCRDGLSFKAKLFLLKNIGGLRKYTGETFIGLAGKILFSFY